MIKRIKYLYELEELKASYERMQKSKNKIYNGILKKVKGYIEAHSIKIQDNSINIIKDWMINMKK